MLDMNIRHAHIHPITPADPAPDEADGKRMEAAVKIIVNTDRNSVACAADCIRIDLAGGLAGYGVQVIRGHHITFAAHISTYGVRQSGNRFVSILLRAFGRGVSFNPQF